MNSFQRQIKYWKTSAKKNLEVAETLYRTKHYDACLFFCHLALEKAIKGLVVIKTKATPPFIHDLERLLLLAGVAGDESKLEQLRKITTFNMAGRYHDAKFTFYKQCTKPYTQKYLKISKELFLWLENQYHKK